MEPVTTTSLAGTLVGATLSAICVGFGLQIGSLAAKAMVNSIFADRQTADAELTRDLENQLNGATSGSKAAA